MDEIVLENDIPVFYVTAKSFPHGIADAHKDLHALVTEPERRKYFGISRPENGRIVYRAAAEEMSAGEAERLTCETLVLRKGNYIGVMVKDFIKDIQAIEKSFEILLASPDLDPNGYCIEQYVDDKDVICMIKLKDVTR